MAYRVKLIHLRPQVYLFPGDIYIITRFVRRVRPEIWRVQKVRQGLYVASGYPSVNRQSGTVSILRDHYAAWRTHFPTMMRVPYLRKTRISPRSLKKIKMFKSRLSEKPNIPWNNDRQGLQTKNKNIGSKDRSILGRGPINMFKVELIEEKHKNPSYVFV